MNVLESNYESTEVFRLPEVDEWGYTHIPLELLHSNSKNIRKIYPRIRELADSIRELGLLQNLVVIETEHGYEIKAGERRFRALQYLAKQGKWDAPILCLVIDAEKATLANAAENCSRQEVPVWHVGLRFLELHEAGLLQEEIAKSIGKSQQYVSYAMNVASNTHPVVIGILDKLDKSLVTARILRQLCQILDSQGLPDLEKQREFLNQMIASRSIQKSPGRPKGSKSRANVAKRLEQLEAMPLPPLQAPIVKAVIHYLKGESTELLL